MYFTEKEGNRIARGIWQSQGTTSPKKPPRPKWSWKIS